MRYPVSGLLFKTSLSLMHNLPEDLMKPIFKKCPNLQQKENHQHQMVEGGCKGHGFRTKLSQVYTTVFCTASIQVFLGLFHGVRGKNVSCLQSQFVSELCDPRVTVGDMYELTASFATRCSQDHPCLCPAVQPIMSDLMFHVPACQQW